jgi:hypothetical protein
MRLAMAVRCAPKFGASRGEAARRKEQSSVARRLTACLFVNIL